MRQCNTDSGKGRKPRRSSCPSGHLAIKAAMRIAAGVDTSYSRLFLQFVKDKNWIGIIELPMPSARGYDCALQFRHDWMVYNLLRKYPLFGVVSTQERADAALNDFLAGNEACKLVNDRLDSHILASPAILGCGLSVDALIMSVQRKIRSVVPKVPTVDELVDGFRLSSGASACLPKSKGDPYYKLQPPFEVTPGTIPYLKGLLQQLPFAPELTSGGKKLLNLKAWNVVDTVEKNSKKGRTIGKEASINMGFQLSVGGMLKRCFSARGPTNMYQQVSQNVLARKGSIDGTVSTVDLENASNSTAQRAIELTWPEGWVAVFDDLRSHYYQLPSGDVGRYHMLSSMGNGFTFEVLSITVWAVCAAVCDLLGVDASGRIGIFGDDLICPSEATHATIDALEFFGYKTNTKKTFVDGPFRESCGKHYFRGVDVTPFYIDGPVSARQQKYWLANSLRLWSSGWGTEINSDIRYKTAWDWLRSQIPRPLVVPFRKEGQLDGLVVEREDLGSGTPGYLVASETSEEPVTNYPASAAKWYCAKQAKGGIGGNGRGLYWLLSHDSPLSHPMWRKLHMDQLLHVEACVTSVIQVKVERKEVVRKDATLLIHWSDPPYWG